MSVARPRAKKLSASGGASPPDPLTRGSAPGPRWGLWPQTPVIGSRSTRSPCAPQKLPMAPLVPVLWRRRCFSKNPLLDPYNPRWLRSAILKIDMTSFFSAEGGPILIKFRRLVQNDMSTAVMCGNGNHVDFQYGRRLGEFNGMSSQSHVSHCRVLPLDEFTVTIPEPHATLQGVRIPPAILKIVFRHILFFFNTV